MEERFLNDWRTSWLEFMLKLEKHDATKHATTYNAISKNANMTLEMIENHPEIEWDWEHVSDNPNLTMDYILAHPDLEWDWDALCEHNNITLDMILAHPMMRRYPRHVVRNPNVTFDMLKTHHYFTTEMTKSLLFNELDIAIHESGNCWHLTDVINNPNISVDNVIELFGDAPQFAEFVSAGNLSDMKQLDLNYVLANPTFQWNIWKIIGNPHTGKQLTDENMHALVTCGTPSLHKTFETVWLCKTCLYSTIHEIMEKHLEYKKQKKPFFLKSTILSNDDITMRNIRMNLTVWNCFGLDMIYKNELPNDRWSYIWNNMNCMLLATMYEQKSVVMHVTLFEWVIADEYILSMICKY